MPSLLPTTTCMPSPRANPVKMHCAGNPDFAGSTDSDSRALCLSRGPPVCVLGEVTSCEPHSDCLASGCPLGSAHGRRGRDLCGQEERGTGVFSPALSLLCCCGTGSGGGPPRRPPLSCSCPGVLTVPRPQELGFLLLSPQAQERSQLPAVGDPWVL